MPLVPEEGAWTTMTAMQPERIAHKRRIVSNLVSNDALSEFAPRGNLYLDTFCRTVGEELGANGWSSPKNITVECLHLPLRL